MFRVLFMWGVFAVSLNGGVLRGQQIPATFPRWQSEPVRGPQIAARVVENGDSSLPHRPDYRYEGLIFAGIALGALGAWVGSQISVACPLDAGSNCGTNRVENGVLLGLAGAAIGGGMGFLIGRFSPKRPPRAVVLQEPSSREMALPDRIRLRSGYQHWKGAAVGTGVGAVLGVVFALAAGTGCSDCAITTGDRMQAALVITGAGGLVGFLAGLASPKYVWVQREISTNSKDP